MTVHKYIPDRMYGFVIDDEDKQYFFHLGAFSPGDYTNPPTPPILGETVFVDISDKPPEEGQAPRANRVTRLVAPELVHGTVQRFDTDVGYGSIIGDNRVTYYLHQSEVLNGRLPLANKQVVFYAGVRQNRPRACYIQVL
jgi:cold shock CspA family protein